VDIMSWPWRTSSFSPAPRWKPADVQPESPLAGRNDALEQTTMASAMASGLTGSGDWLLKEMGHGDLLASPCGCRCSPPSLPEEPRTPIGGRGGLQYPDLYRSTMSSGGHPSPPPLQSRTPIEPDLLHELPLPSPPPRQQRPPVPDSHEEGVAQRPSFLGKEVAAAAMARLFYLMHWLYELQSTRPEEFRSEYGRTAREAVQLAKEADFGQHGTSSSASALPSVLHYAAGCGCLEVAAAIIARCGRLAFAVDPVGRTPLLWAADRGLVNTVQLLVRHGSDILHVDDCCQTALHLVASRNFLACARVLLAAAEPESRPRLFASKDSRSLTALHIAASAGHVQMVELLLQYGCPAGLETFDGRTALHLSAMEGYDEVVQVLLAAAPDLQNVTDTKGWRAVDYARQRGWRKPADVLGTEEEAQRKLHVDWRGRWEPGCRTRLNVAACDAFLEIGRSRLMGRDRTSFKVGCRVVDVLGLLEHFSIEIAYSGNFHIRSEGDARDCETVVALPCSVRVGKPRQKSGSSSSSSCPRDVELKASLEAAERSLPSYVRLSSCWVRVVASLSANANMFHLGQCQARSPWTQVFSNTFW